MYELLISMQKYYGSQTSGANKIVRASMDIRSAGETTRRTRRRKNAEFRIFTSRGAYINWTIIAMLYTHSIGNQP